MVSILAFHAGYQGSSPCIGTLFAATSFLFLFPTGCNGSVVVFVGTVGGIHVLLVVDCCFGGKGDDKFPR